jgi:5-methyltetrahydropteroyltriglutamate--homocysteine methyltransferase
MSLPILPTTVVGSYSMPGWLERLKTEYFARRISRVDLDEIHDTAVKAAIKDEEVAGLDIITDGELRRDNMIDYFVERMPGVQINHASKKFYYDFYDSVVEGKLPHAPLGLAEDFRFLRANTDREAKFCVTGPHSLSKRIRNNSYPNEAEFARAIADVLNLELKDLVKAGARYIQIDEPYYSGFPEDLAWGVEVLNTLVEGVDAKIGVHICYGNRYGKPSWEGSYKYLVPKIFDAKVQQLTLEFARRGDEDLELLQELAAHFDVGVGVIDVKTHSVETADIVAERIRKALKFAPANRLFVLPDCGCFHLPRHVAFAKLCAMVEGTRIVRRELGL